MNEMLVPKITDDLSRSWRILAGRDLSFSSDFSCPEFFDAELYVLMIYGERQADHAAILYIARPDLVEVTAAMFDTEAGLVDMDQIEDVGRELCNIMGSCCANLLRDEQGNLEIGVPKVITAQALNDLLSRSTVLCEFVACNIAGSPTLRIVRCP